MRFLITCVYVSTHSRPKAAGQNQLHLSHVCLVSTHSRPKAAGGQGGEQHLGQSVSTHSRPKAAGMVETTRIQLRYCFNTQPPEGGWACNHFFLRFVGSFNTQPPEGGWLPNGENEPLFFEFQHTAARRRLEIVSRLKHDLRLFQHTAARRRLGLTATSGVLITDVSTHSRPKAAGLGFWAGAWFRLGFNTQPPEGGWA